MPVILISQGQINTHAGSDFFNAKIEINSTLWAGNVELHIKTSDWDLHKHSADLAYSNVILHVVWEHDKVINYIPVLELKNLVNPHLIEQYKTWMKTEKWIPCEDEIKNISPFILKNTLDSKLAERLERKSSCVLSLLQNNNSDWEETLYQSIAKGFGLKINSEPFELLATTIPFKVLLKHKNSLHQIESLLYGQAGFLDNNFEDDYFNNLKKEYNFLKQKFGLKPIEKHLWKFMRLRPASFPTIRISQFANLIYSSQNLFSEIIETENIKDLQKLFACKTSGYWQTHYIFGKKTKTGVTKMGLATINNLIINTVVPFLFIYGKHRNKPELVDKAFFLLEQLPAEKNVTISNFEELGIKAKTMYQSQALLELKNEYCTFKKCLNCSIAFQLLK